MFLVRHQHLLSTVAAQTAQGKMDPARERIMAASVKLSVVDFHTIGTVYEEIEPLLQAVDKDADAYRDEVLARGGKLDPKVYRAFSARKTTIESLHQAPAAGEGVSCGLESAGELHRWRLPPDHPRFASWRSAPMKRKKYGGSPVRYSQRR